MSRHTVYHCDRCGNSCDRKVYEMRTWFRLGKHGPDRQACIELCEECKTSLDRWWSQ